MARRIASSRKLSNSKEIHDILQDTTAFLAEALAAGVSVRWKDFGTFYTRSRKTGLIVKIRPAAKLKASLKELQQDIEGEW
jgi:nucleoid DNA-binding protein